MIVFDNVSLQYHYDEFVLLKEVSFSLVCGVNTVLCDIQSGKSSLCKLLTKRVKPTNGKIIYYGEDISCITNERLGILYLSNRPTFFERKSVTYNVEYPLAVRKYSKEERRAAAEQTMRLAGVKDTNAKTSRLDASERKKVALARGLTVPRRVILFDDFFDEGDDVNAILNMFDADVKVILTSDVRLAQGNVVVLDGGRTVYQGEREQAEQLVGNLGWLYYELRRENGK